MFYIENNSGYNVDTKYVKKCVKVLLKYLNEKRDFSIHFVTKDEIHILNKEYRGNDDSTDILTFRFQDGEEFPFSDNNDLGDMFISYEDMLDNTLTYSVDEKEELSRLLLHGILHLEGLDHKTNDTNKEEMLIKQESILKELKIKTLKNF